MLGANMYWHDPKVTTVNKSRPSQINRLIEFYLVGNAMLSLSRSRGHTTHTSAGVTARCLIHTQRPVCSLIRKRIYLERGSV